MKLTSKEAIAILKTGSDIPNVPHTAEMIDEACRMACAALRKKPHICVVLGVMPEQEFFWRGYTLKVTGDYAQVCKKVTSDVGWIGLEGSAVCDLINNVEEIMRVSKPNFEPNEPLTLIELSGMVGEPVWVRAVRGRFGQYDIVDEVDIERKAVYMRADFNLHNYGTEWLAYRRKPEEVGE